MDGAVSRGQNVCDGIRSDDIRFRSVGRRTACVSLGCFHKFEVSRPSIPVAFSPFRAMQSLHFTFPSDAGMKCDQSEAVGGVDAIVACEEVLRSVVLR